METDKIVKAISKKYIDLLFELEKDYENILTNKINGLVVKVNVKPITESKDDYFLNKGQDFFKVDNIKQALSVLDSLGFKDKDAEFVLKHQHSITFNKVDENSPFFLGLYILESVKRQ
jgi:hypothetical protein